MSNTDWEMQRSVLQGELQLRIKEIVASDARCNQLQDLIDKCTDAILAERNQSTA